MSAEIIAFPRRTPRWPVDTNGLCTKAAACPCDDPCSFMAKMLGPIPHEPEPDEGEFVAAFAELTDQWAASRRRPRPPKPPLIFEVPLFPAVPDDPDDAPAA